MIGTCIFSGPSAHRSCSQRLARSTADSREQPTQGCSHWAGSPFYSAAMAPDDATNQAAGGAAATTSGVAQASGGGSERPASTTTPASAALPAIPPASWHCGFHTGFQLIQNITTDVPPFPPASAPCSPAAPAAAPARAPALPGSSSSMRTRKRKATRRAHSVLRAPAWWMLCAQRPPRQRPGGHCLRRKRRRWAAPQPPSTAPVALACPCTTSSMLPPRQCRAKAIMPTMPSFASGWALHASSGEWTGSSAGCGVGRDAELAAAMSSSAKGADGKKRGRIV